MKKFTPYTFVGPAIILLLIFNFYPMLDTLYLSFMTQKRGIFSFIGFENYKRLILDQFFWLSLKNSLIYLAIQVPIMTLLALGLASLLHRSVKFAKGFFRASFFVPVIVDSVAYSLIFLLIFQEQGILNYVLSFFNVSNIPWTTQPWPARSMIMLVMTWRWLGYNMLMFLAGMQAIPEELYESARIDGADSFSQFRHITIPSLMPIIIFSVILSTNGTINLFSEPYLLTNGSPNNSTLSIGLYIYRQAFQSFDLTYSATISIAVVLIIAGLSYLQLKLGGKHE